MSDVSLHGRVAPKSKSINVEANLLAERLQIRSRVRLQMRRRFVIYFVGVFTALFVLPPANRFYKRTFAEYQAAVDQEKKVSQRLDAVQKQQESAKPAIQDKQTLESLHRHAHEYLGHVTLFLNNVSPKVSLSTLSVQWKDHAMEFTTQALAISYKEAANFVELTGKSPNAKQTVLSTMSSDPTMGPEGVNFSLDQTVGVSP